MRLPTLLPAAAALLLAASSALAAPDIGGDLGVNPCSGSMNVRFVGAVATPIDLVYRFALTGRHDALAAAAVLPGRQGFQMRNAMVTLWRSNGDEDFLNDELLGGFDFDTAAIAQAFPALPAGRYFWRLEGIADGSEGGAIFNAAVGGAGSCNSR